MSKLTTCKVCKKEIAKSAKRCPHCGAKLKHPIRNVLLGILGFIIFCSIIGSIDNGESGGIPGTTPIANESTSTHDLINYIETTVKQMQNDLTENALAAKNKYNGNYIEVTGYLQTIDANGNYISISNSAELELFENTITCNIKSDEVRNKVASLTKNQKVVIKGYVTNVDEVWGYTLKIIDIN